MEAIHFGNQGGKVRRDTVPGNEHSFASRAIMVFVAVVFLLSMICVSVPAFAQDKAMTKGKAMMKSHDMTQSQQLRTIAPSRAKSVKLIRGFKAKEGGAAVTCCTHWNSSTGGTGCASFEGSCPDNQFEVECGSSGCW